MSNKHGTKRALWLAKLFVIALIPLLLLNSCAAIFHSERVNQPPERRGNFDVGMFALDTVLLVFYVVPGLIAYAIDFGTGAIYVPK